MVRKEKVVFKVFLFKIMYCYFRDAKVIILGDYAVGKTSLVSRYVDGKFGPHETVCAFYLYKMLYSLIEK